MSAWPGCHHVDHLKLTGQSQETKRSGEGEFIATGSVMALAVGVSIGAAFQKIVDSLVNDLIVQFLILAWLVFLMVKAVNRMRRTA